jgi:hypothetical protein
MSMDGTKNTWEKGQNERGEWRARGKRAGENTYHPRGVRGKYKRKEEWRHKCVRERDEKAKGREPWDLRARTSGRLGERPCGDKKRG